jgi:diacylglycerol kinase (ATP)
MIVLLYNSFSNAGKGARTAQLIIHELVQKGIALEHHCDIWPELIPAEAKIWIVGGDGTLNYFLNKYGILPNPVGIFEGGTGNDLYWKIHGNRSVHNQIDFLLNSQNNIHVDVGQCNEELFINGVGIGFDGEVLKKMKNIRRIGGHLGYLVQVIKTIFSYREQTFSLDFNKQKLSQTLLLLNIGNSSRTGGGFHISPLAEINDGLLNILLCQKLSIINRLRYLPVIEKGNHLSLPFISHYTTTSINITAEKKCFYQLDGELRKAQKFNISILNEKIRVIS